MTPDTGRPGGPLLSANPYQESTYGCNSLCSQDLQNRLGPNYGTEGVRAHWSIENHLHWQLDVTFGEDQCRIRQGHADVNFSILRRTVLSMLKNETTAKVGVKYKRLKCGWDEAYLDKVLTGS